MCLRGREEEGKERKRRDRMLCSVIHPKRTLPRFRHYCLDCRNRVNTSACYSFQSLPVKGELGQRTD